MKVLVFYHTQSSIHPAWRQNGNHAEVFLQKLGPVIPDVKLQLNAWVYMATSTKLLSQLGPFIIANFPFEMSAGHHFVRESSQYNGGVDC